MTSAFQRRFEASLVGFPAGVQPILRRLPHQMGMLAPQEVTAICTAMDLTPSELALALLPTAQVFARPAISGFRVGAVAQAVSGLRATSGSAGATVPEALFLGANLEFTGLPLCHTIHAEQSAVLNAWRHGASRLTSLAVSAAPCGSCRQFLREAVGSRDLIIRLPTDGSNRQVLLSDLLPEAFGAEDLNRRGGLFEPPTTFSAAAAEFPGRRHQPGPHPTPQKMAATAYAPYTDNRAGCRLTLDDGRVVTMGSIENAAFNPSLTALQAALALACLTGARLPEAIQRIELAEQPTATTQSGAAAWHLAEWAPAAEVITQPFSLEDTL
ncbi:MAG: cytidine deaminase [Desulfosarcinaceae bacterium]|nr:cytidine deaminase [Desulfosarcinaceae bacterium]